MDRHAQTAPTPLEQVVDVIASPQIYTANADRLMQQLAPMCKRSTLSKREQLKRGNVECAEPVRADSFAISATAGGSVGFIQASFGGAANCAYFKKVLSKNFGKPTKVKGECEMEWRLKPAGKGGADRYASFETSTADDTVYLRSAPTGAVSQP